MSQTQTQQEVFDRLASGWYGYRHHTIFRAELEQLAARWQGGRLLNLGCGHGADFLPFTKSALNLPENVTQNYSFKSSRKIFELYGLDFSLEMLRLAQKFARKYSFDPFLFQADMRSLPFRDEFFDHAVAVASYHHIKNKADRPAAFMELKRVMKSGGEAFITVWNHWQPRFWFKRSDTLVPWRAGSEFLYRYYHLYSYHEVVKEIRRSGLTIIRSFPENSYRFPLKYFSRNICLLVKKA